MEVDKTTLHDLSIFGHGDDASVLRKIDFTRTTGGREDLHHLLQHPYHDLGLILQTQQILRSIIEKESLWPLEITNGTIMVIEKFYVYNFDPIPHSNSPLDALTYKLLHGPDYSMLRYSLGHFIDFLKGMHRLTTAFPDAPPLFRDLLSSGAAILDQPLLKGLISASSPATISRAQLLASAHYLLYRFKAQVNELIRIYHRCDAYYSMARAHATLGLHFPTIHDQPTPVVEVRGLFHLLLKDPVPYDLTLDHQNNFLFLTGANMAGKSTFIRAIGISVFLAHAGMGVPATHMELSLFDGLLSNINVQDNVLAGESYFYNEVQRIKNTVLKVTDGRKWLILIDELFKGTNVQDAMNCSGAVIRGLIKVKSSLFVLSTHLYEIGESLRPFPNIAFRYFETFTEGDQLRFSYQLREGISNDRLGYLILRREKVVELLEQIPDKP